MMIRLCMLMVLIRCFGELMQQLLMLCSMFLLCIWLLFLFVVLSLCSVCQELMLFQLMEQGIMVILFECFISVQLMEMFGVLVKVLVVSLCWWYWLFFRLLLLVRVVWVVISIFGVWCFSFCNMVVVWKQNMLVFYRYLLLFRQDWVVVWLGFLMKCVIWKLLFSGVFCLIQLKLVLVCFGVMLKVIRWFWVVSL